MKIITILVSIQQGRLKTGQGIGERAATDQGVHRNLFSAGPVGSVLPSLPQSEKLVSYVIALTILVIGLRDTLNYNRSRGDVGMMFIED
jgi:hypothetical protein